MNTRSVARDVIRHVFSALLLNRATAPLYNHLFERSPHRITDLMNRLHIQPDFDMIWTIRLMNGCSVRVPVCAGDPRSWEFATAYHWHDVGIRVLEHAFLSKVRASGKEAAVLDVGGNMGVRSLLPLSMGFQSIIFEPNQGLRGFSEQLFQRNGFNRYEIVNVCISDQNGTSPFYLSANSYGSSLDRQWPALGTGMSAIDVNVTTLDHWLSGRPEVARKVALVKIDVEGAELKVLSGARMFITSRRPHLIVEVCDHYDNRRKVAQFLEQTGYRIFLIKNTDRIALQPLDSDDFVEVKSSTNFFIVPSENDLVNLI
jgi:FkbM family methyltransferase